MTNDLIESSTIVNLSSGDVVIIKTPYPIPREVSDQIKTDVANAFDGFGVKVLVLDTQLEISFCKRMESDD